jgi:hypothetical protein
MANGEYTRRQFNDYSGLNVCEEWRTAETPSASLAYVDHYNGAISSVTVFDPATGHARSYNMRPKDRVLAIVERHLARNGYKKRVEFHRLDGTVETA